MHLDDETLRAFLDRQMEPADGAAEHLNACAGCQSRLAAMQARAERVHAHLQALDPGPADAPLPARTAFTRLTARGRGWERTARPANKEKITMTKTMFSQRLRPVWISLCAVAILAVAFSFPSVRAFASDMLARLRVQQIQVVQLDSNRLSELGGNSALGKQIGQLVSDSMKVTKEPSKPRVVASAAEASKQVGFTVRVPGNRSDAPTITVQDGGAFEFVVNRSRAQTLLNEAGASNIQLPASVDGANVKVSIPAGATIAYGNCPKPGDPEPSKTSPARQYTNCTMVVENPSPTVDTPPNMNVQQLAELGLQFGGMSADQARAFSQRVDWTSTLVIPLPRNGATYKELTVDGVTGYLIQRPAGDASQYVIVWVKNGIIYAVGGTGSDSAAGLAMANSLK
jgi:hypothetical protein